MALFSKTYSFRKSRNVLVACNKWYQKNWKTLNPNDLNNLENNLAHLEEAIDKKSREEASQLAEKAETFVNPRNKKNIGSFFVELVFALAFALVVATTVRQVWFEPYEIPSGSMRPTYKEQDHLVVSKTPFGINIPIKAKHLYFDPSLVERGSIVIWSGENIDLPNSDTTYFWILPYKKRYVKRLIGKPGDTLYFYGGKVWGLDKSGKEITDLRNDPYLEKLEYLPFSNFEGRTNLVNNQVVLRHFNQPVARVSASPSGTIQGEVYREKQWKKESLEADQLSDFWGMGNFAMARLLTKEQVGEFTQISPDDIQEGVLYLELRHSPNLQQPEPRFFKTFKNEVSVLLTPRVSIIPLQQEHLDKIMDNLYTARFDVKDGEALAYSLERRTHRQYAPRFVGVPDGRYEFYYGKGSQIGFGGTPYPLKESHPLNKKTPENIQKLFNLGIEFSTLFSPSSKEQVAFPSRYAYFRDGDLYLMGAPILEKEDPYLKKFVEEEKKKERGFYDHGSPSRELIETYGLKVPEKHYLVLGDNHAMSADSRYFGFVPEDNLRGTPSFLIWPFDKRVGAPPQMARPWFTLSNVVIWSLGALVILACYLSYLRKYKKPIFKRLSS